ncbi:hypothetical protein RJ639_042450 [Escallonia herrerae]|uniref:Beta-Casp domain-containing protein n=1 Tax=Escallonia herrerae TaxID=1293975 RepID=A0AA88WJ27_9ASTE|nr:hypothetical protein RJ639_042450 [Escallonia herrerae]
MQALATCLSEGGGFHFPACHLLSVSGFRVLFDCPLDLSALTVFSPIPTDARQKIEKLLDANNLIQAEPCYKSVNNLHLLDVSLIDIILISSPMGMLGLPFLTCTKDFSAKIYATEATARHGQLMMGDLVAMHMEFRQFYGPEESGLLQWMKWEELEMLPLAFRERILGKDGSELGGWMPLYSAADVKSCMQRVQVLKYAEQACNNGSITIKAFSSGLEIGSCNWTISSPKANIGHVSSSIFQSETAMDFNYHALQGCDAIIYSDNSARNILGNVEDENYHFASVNSDLSIKSDTDNSWEVIGEALLNADERSEEMEKLAFISSCAVDSVEAGGSVLVPIGRLGIVLQLLEQLSLSLKSSNLKVPIYVISTIAEELMAFTNIIPEWLCKLRQEKLYSGEPLFAHVELTREKRLHTFPAVHSLELLKIWQEPCIVFCPHWSLRLGPVVHLLRRWCRDQNSLLVMEEGVDAELALLPFKPMAMKALQCSFLSGIKLQKVQPLLKILQPDFVVFPKYLRRHIGPPNSSSSFLGYSENQTLRIPNRKELPELYISMDLATQLSWTKLDHKDTSIARLKGELVMEHGQHLLLLGNEQAISSDPRSLLHWGAMDLESLLAALQKMGIKGSVEQGMSDAGSEIASVLHIFEPSKALIEVKATTTVISTSDESLASLISEAVNTILNSI